MKLNNKGFSLIELSIVLIIIGLLVAGITGGASLIKSAELRAVMSEVRNYQTAVNAYYTATGKLPGGLDDTGLNSDKINAKKYFKAGEVAKAVFPYVKGATIYSYCNKHGLWETQID